VVHDPETGLRAASRDFETARTIVLEGKSLLGSVGGAVNEPQQRSTGHRLSHLRLPSILKYFVLFAPIVLVAVLLVFTVRQTINIVPKLVPSSTDVFRSLRVGTLKVDAALRDIEPKNREELLVAIRSIVASLKPYADEIRPLLNGDNSDTKALGVLPAVPQRGDTR
jgi:hypothetical protein